MIEDKNKKISKDMFEFVQLDEKLHDIELETKPIGYFKDAMLRFGKNRTNVIATSILFILIVLSVIIPIFSSKNYIKVEEQLSFLPPKIPLLEKIGIADGTSLKEDQPVDLNTIDPETNIGLPLNYNPDLILLDTLENYTVGCTDKIDLCVGGDNVLRLDPGSRIVSIESIDYYAFDADTDQLNLTIESISDESTLNVYLKPSLTSDYELLYTTDSSGTHTIKVFDVFSDQTKIQSKIILEFKAVSDKSTVAIQSISTMSGSVPVQQTEGYLLSQFSIIDGAGLYVRQNGLMTLSRFRFDNYQDAFGEKLENGFSKDKYDQILLDNPDVCVASVDPNNPDGWIFAEGCPIVKVIKQNESVVVKGEEYYSYQLIIDYALFSGYDSMPYFLFGTTGAGRDLFTLIWVATRTSLLIGLIVAAINISIGIVYGAISGYYGGVVDLIMQRFAEVISRVPFLVTLSIFITLIGPGLKTLILVLIVSGWIGVSYVTRTQFYRYKGREYVLASRTLGAKDSRLIFRHILPNGIGTIITASILMIPYVIFSESTLSYLGYGIGHGQSFDIFGVQFSGVSIGVLLADGRTELLSNPYLTVFPALIISILMITFNMFGNALRDAFNPALRGSE